MTQSSNKIFDDLAKLMTDAAGVAQGVRNEVEMAFKVQLERLLSDMEIVQREEFEVFREMAIKTREENEMLKDKVKNLESILTKHGIVSDDAKNKRTNSKKSKTVEK